jgi:hypothetical protein
MVYIGIKVIRNYFALILNTVLILFLNGLIRFLQMGYHLAEIVWTLSQSSQAISSHLKVKHVLKTIFGG